MTAALALHQPQLLLPQFEPEHWVYLDAETYYDQDYSLRKMTTVDYVRDPRFELIGMAVDDGEDRMWMEEREFAQWVRTVPWDKVALVAHNAQFDGFILSHHYGVHPGFLLCTMSMARAFGIDGGVSLENLGVKFGVGAKGKEVLEAKGKRRADFTQEEWLRYGEYSMNDVVLMKGILDKMLATGFPEAELWNVHMTICMFTNPRLFIDEQLLRGYLAEERARKADLLKRVELDRSIVLSADKFAAELAALGVDPPMKLSPKQRNEDGSPKAIYAFAKNDPGMQDLLEHEIDDVRYLAEARVALKSTINETRTERFLRIGGGARTIPVQLNYYGAHTGRWCMKPDSEVLTPTGWVRMDEFSGGEIAQWSPDQKIRWAPATMNKFPYDGELVCAPKSVYMRGAFTPEHVIPTWTTGGNFKPRLARDAAELNVAIAVGGDLQANGLPISDALLRLMVAIQADGTIEDPKSRPIRFKFRKERKMIRLRELLAAAEIPHTEFDTLPERAFSIARRHVPSVLWGAKQFGWSLLQLNAHQREVFLEELRFWDAAVDHGEICYSTTVRQNADVVAALAALSGRTSLVYKDTRSTSNARWNDLYSVMMRKRKFVHVLQQYWGTEQYTGYVYCPTTETGFFVVRCNGSAFITGNSGAGRLNTQNLERTNKKNPKKGILRKSLLAPLGHKVLAADSGQIEARIVAWLAGHEELLQAFREKRDVYSEFASVIYNRTIDRKKNPEDEIPGQVGKVCWAADTPVLTQRGWVPIVEVRQTDLLWDGVDWVAHRGLLDRGEKEAWRSHGVAATPDHEILTERGWVEWREALTNPFLFRSALRSVRLPCSVGNGLSQGVDERPVFTRTCDVTAVGRVESTVRTSSRGELGLVTRARNGSPLGSGTGSTKARSLMTQHGSDFLIASLLVSLAATIRKTRAIATTAVAAFRSLLHGELIALHFWPTFEASPVGTTPSWSSIGSTTTGDTSRAISVSSRSARTSETSARSGSCSSASATSKEKTRVYDLLSCGSRQRFTVLTDCGPVLAHNCILGLGYGLGWQKLAQTFLQGNMTNGIKIQFTEDDAQIVGVDLTKFFASEMKMKKVEEMPSRLDKEALAIHCAVTDKIVQKWRNTNDPIVELWHTMEEVLEVMCGEEQFTFGPNDCLSTERHAIVLPNGMKLRYPGLKYQEEDSLGGYEGFSYLGQYGKQWVRIYGGSAVENLTQALARIVVAEQMLHVKAVTGEEPALSTHDEWVWLPTVERAEYVKHIALEAMRTTPAWAVGLPLAVEGGLADRYGEAK